MSDVFLTHASEDKPFVRALADALRRDGLDVWFDENIGIGDAWAPEITKEIAESRCVIVCWSESAITKASSPDKLWIRSEADAALRGGAIMSVLLDDVKPPMPYDQIQTLRLVGWKGDRSQAEYRALLAEVRRKLESRSTAGETKSAQPAGRRALLIGVRGGGDPQLPSLPATEGNIKGLESALRQPACGFQVVKLVDPTYKTLMRGLKEFLDGCRPGSLALLYFCGHLVFAEGGSLCLTAKDTELDLIDATTVPLSWIRARILAKSPEGPRLLLIDGCYKDADPEKVKDALHDLAQGNVIIASAAGPGSGAETWKDQQSPFTGYVIRALSSADADSDKNKIVTAQEMFDYVSKQIEKAGRLPPPHLLSRGCDPSQLALTAQLKGGAQGPPPNPEQMALVRLLAPEMDVGGVVIFLGDGVFGTEWLSGLRLTNALADKAGLGTAQRDEGIIATPAEWLEQQHDSRELFLSIFRKILEEQSARCLPNAAHDLVLDAKRPWLTISATYDRLLEDRLDEAGVPYVLLTHIRHSKGGKDDNKVLVLRNRHHPLVKRDSSMEAEICLPDEVYVDENDCILYKLLGSPFLHDIQLAKQHELDTVFATESDHMTFLMALRHGHTVPTVLAPRLDRKRLLFLGFNLHLWHYRLLGHLFSVSQGKDSSSSGVLHLCKDPIAIPPPATALEGIFWKRLKPEAVMDINLSTLVHALRAERSTAQ
jgi:hypothetical protein